MKTRSIPLAILFLATITLPCKSNGQHNADPRMLEFDLNRDGQLERVTWTKFAETEDGDLHQLRVFGHSGNLIWEGPRETDHQSPFFIGAFHYGISLPEIIGDVDGDGAFELVIPDPQSDVSPTSYRVLRWKGGQFVETRNPAGSLLESPIGSGSFPWKRNSNWQGTWISSFLSVNPDGSILVQVTEYKQNGSPRNGVASVAVSPEGYRILKWTQPLSGAEQGNGVPIEKPFPNQGVVYRARLSAQDHFNSKGERLTTVRDVLRQDRANFHRGNGDREDGHDPIFSTLASRESMEKLTPAAKGIHPSALKNAIVERTPLVEIELKGTVLRVKILEP